MYNPKTDERVVLITAWSTACSGVEGEPGELKSNCKLFLNTAKICGDESRQLQLSLRQHFTNLDC